MLILRGMWFEYRSPSITSAGGTGNPPWRPPEININKWMCIHISYVPRLTDYDNNELKRDNIRMFYDVSFP